MKLVYLMCAMLLANAAWAMPDVVVSGIRMPAWVERGGVRTPARLGMALHEADVLITGHNARLLLNSADGSDIKLGQEARMALTGLLPQRPDNSVFSMVLNVAKGAFRFTTSALNKLRERNVTVKVASATVGIRGTDVWGKDGKDAKGDDLRVVCLIEGKISVVDVDKKEFVMDQPLSFYKMPKDAAPLPVAPVPAEQIKKWAAETEIADGQGALRSGGKWKVDLLTLTGQQAAQAAYDELRTAGFDVRIIPIDTNQYRLRVSQLPSKAEGEALARQLIGKAGINAPQVSR
jgi:hypothetical protein